MPIHQVLRPDFQKRGGVITVVVQDSKTDRVLMVAYTNEEMYVKTIETGFLHLFSTSRNKSWKKGEDSGNIMEVISIDIDCDGDAILYHVIVHGPGVACHTDAKSCFYRSVFTDRLEEAAPKAGKKEVLQTMTVQSSATFPPYMP